MTEININKRIRIWKLVLCSCIYPTSYYRDKVEQCVSKSAKQVWTCNFLRFRFGLGEAEPTYNLRKEKGAVDQISVSVFLFLFLLVYLLFLLDVVYFAHDVDSWLLRCENCGGRGWLLRTPRRLLVSSLTYSILTSVVFRNWWTTVIKDKNNWSHTFGDRQ